MNIGLRMTEFLKVTRKLFKKSFQNIDVDLPFDAFIILGILNEHDEMIQNDIATFLKKDKSSVLRQIDALEEQKLVVRIPDITDRRRKIITLTKAGVRLIERLNEIQAELFNSLVEGIDEEELKIFDRVLQKMQSKVL